MSLLLDTHVVLWWLADDPGLPEEIKDRCPIISVDGVLGGMWADREGYVDTTGTVWAYAGAAKKRGATVIEHNRVLELKQRPD